MQISEASSIYIYIIKLFLITSTSISLYLKLINLKPSKFITIQLIISLSFACSITGIIRYNSNYIFSTLFLLFSLNIINILFYKFHFSSSIFLTTISLSISYLIFFISISISFFICAFLNYTNDIINILIISIFQIIISQIVFNIKRIKKGFPFFYNKITKDFFYILFFSIGSLILFIAVTFSIYSFQYSVILFVCFIAFMFILSFIIYKSFNFYYKYKILLNSITSSEELCKKQASKISYLESEILALNKENHSLRHEIKSLKYKLEHQNFNEEFSTELSSIKNISLDEQTISDIPILPKTGISEIDDIINCYQNECIKNNISFELQLNENIYYMVNHCIPKEKLAILLADLIKNSIIAINASENIYKSILVRLGLIDGIYSLYIYDTGIEFDKNVLEKLGSGPVTTHADTGGSGYGFMNTFDTLKECDASFEIKEIGPPCNDNYTKVLIFKFNKM